MLLVEVTDADILLAETRSKFVGTMKGSRTNGKGNVVGFLGEIIVSRLLNTELMDTFDYDLLYKNMKADVKTKSCSSAPKPHYLCSVMSYQIDHDCEYYIFCRANLASKQVWVLGGISKERILTCRFSRKGEKDGAFSFTEDCWSIEVSGLDSLL